MKSSSRIPAFFHRLTSLAGGSQFAAGVALGFGGIAFHQGWVATFGEVLSARIVAVWMATLGVLAALRFAPALRKVPAGNWSFLLGAVVVTAPWLLDLASLPLGLISAEALASRSLQMLVLLPGACLMCGCPAFLAACAVMDVRRHTTAAMTPILLGALTGLLFGVNVVAPWLGPLWLGWISAAMLMLVGVRLMWRSPLPTTEATTDMTIASSAWSQYVVIGAFALCLPAISQVTGQWVLRSAWNSYVVVFAFLCGLLCADWFRQSRVCNQLFGRLPRETSLFATLSVVCSMFVFSEFWIRQSLSINVLVSSSWSILLCRSLILGIVPFCFGWTARRFVSLASPNRTGILLIGAGCWTFSTLATAVWANPDVLVAVGSICIAAIPPLERLRTPELARSRKIAWGAAAAAFMTIGALCIRYSPFESARVLFNGTVAMFAQKDLEWSRLQALDAVRPVDVVAGETGLLTTWNSFGLQTAVKRDGIPVGYLSHDVRLMPHSPTDVLLTTLPLTLHDSPLSVCFLGWGVGVPVSTALEFPVARVVCADAESALPELTYPQAKSAPEQGINPQLDDRMTFLPVSPSLALRSQMPAFDVIVSNPPISALAQASPEYTAEFYRAAAKQLNPGGIFCQRLQHADQGVDGFLDILSTMKSAFPHMLTINFMPGETLLVGRVDREFGTLDELPERFQAEHVARVLSRCGWDWGNLVGIPMLSPATVELLLEERAGHVNRAGNDRIAFAHAFELVRWGNKWQEKQEAFSGLQWRVIDLAGEAAQSEEVKRRIEETKLQQYVMSEVTDRPWAYRANLKKQLQTKPRTKLVQVKGERPHQELHPVDNQRFEYLKALSRAYKETPPSAEKIHRLTEFTAPYDPMLSYFIHFEVAELYSRNSELDPRAEFLHRLHTVYFGDARDRSVRNVTECVRMLAEHPELAESDQARFDQINGLLQILYQRWQARRGLSPDSVSVALNDITESITVAELGVSAMDSIAGPEASDGDYWQERKRFFEGELIRPLRSYRGQMLPHQEKLLHKMKSATVEEDESADFSMDEPDEPVVE